MLILKLIRNTITIGFLMFAAVLHAQVDNYKAEIGILGGGSFYLGDANSQLFSNVNSDFGFIYRQKLNPRIALAAMWNSTKVTGNYNLQSFNNSVNAVDLVGEFNFFDYEDKVYRPNSRKQCVYIFGGLGGMLFPYTNSGGTNLDFMFHYTAGLGYKVMLRQRFNLNLMWSQKLLLNDKMEGVSGLNNSAGLNGSNLLNNDCLSTFTIALTLNIWKDKCDCKQNYN